jgi:hypothetical protein
VAGFGVNWLDAEEYFRTGSHRDVAKFSGAIHQSGGPTAFAEKIDYE